MSSSSHELCYVTLEGPAFLTPWSPLTAIFPWTKPEWRRIVVELKVGSEQWPTWDRVNLGLTAIQEMLLMADGCLSDEVITALRNNVTILELETFRGPPARE